MSHPLAGATIYYRAASDTTTDLSAAIDPEDTSTYTGTGTSVTPGSFSSVGNVYRIKAMAVSATGILSPETAIQRYDYGDVDGDDDGLIDIYTLDMFDNMRLNLAGTSYNGVTTGGPTSMTANCTTDPDSDGIFLCGYELMGNLDFALPASYESETVNGTWCPAPLSDCIGSTSQAGFPGIGPATGYTGFTGIFEGNGNSISNFYSRNTANTDAVRIGLFNINTGGTIRNIAVEANVFGGTNREWIGGLVGYNNSGRITGSSASGSTNGAAGDDDNVGGLVGYNNGGSITESSASGNANGGVGNRDYVGGLVGRSTGTITASYATGEANGENGDDDRVGGLVGDNSGTITASYAIGNADGGTGDDDFVGGLVGYSLSGTITASHATGLVDGGDGDDDRVGGLVGFNNGGITASYATGDADGGAGDDRVGGLIGQNSGGIIRASYATGNVDGGSEDDRIGGLVGYNDNSSVIRASYATGNVDGGDGSYDRAAGLVGFNSVSTITASYGFGTLTGAENGGVDGTARPSGVSSANDLTAGNADASWNAANLNTSGAWNFGTTSENPALVYNDYDGGGTTFASCTPDNGGYPDTIPGTTTMLTCGTTLVGGDAAQGR